MTDEELLDKITRIRSHNNMNWMDILRIALRADPKATKEVLGKILIMDLEVSRLTRALANEDWKPRNLDRTSPISDS